MTPIELQQQADFLRGSLVDDAVSRGTADAALRLHTHRAGAHAAADTERPGGSSVPSHNCCPTHPEPC